MADQITYDQFYQQSINQVDKLDTELKEIAKKVIPSLHFFNLNSQYFVESQNATMLEKTLPVKEYSVVGSELFLIKAVIRGMTHVHSVYPARITTNDGNAIIITKINGILYEDFLDDTY